MNTSDNTISLLHPEKFGRVAVKTTEIINPDNQPLLGMDIYFDYNGNLTTVPGSPCVGKFGETVEEYTYVAWK